MSRRLGILFEFALAWETYRLIYRTLLAIFLISSDFDKLHIRDRIENRQDSQYR